MLVRLGLAAQVGDIDVAAFVHAQHTNPASALMAGFVVCVRQKRQHRYRRPAQQVRGAQA